MTQATAERNGVVLAKELAVTEELVNDAGGDKGSGGSGERKSRRSHLRWVRIGDMVPHPRVQRKFNQARADAIAANLDLESIGFLLVVEGPRGIWYVVDGQHRLAALKLFGFCDDDLLQCETYDAMTTREAARQFLRRNDTLTVNPLTKFRVGVDAEEAEDTAIDACVRHQGLRVGRPSDAGVGAERPAVGAIGSLRTIYRHAGSEGLGKVLRIIRDAYGAAGFEAPLIAGLGLLVRRDPELDEAAMVKALSEAVGGLNGVYGQAAKTRATMNQPRSQCIAATAVDFYNRHVPAKAKLAPWWKV